MNKHRGEDRTWLRFTCATLLPTIAVVIIGGVLSYDAVERVALNAGFGEAEAAWFPLTLDLPVLVGYAGAIALRGRPSVYFARFVLAVSGAATVAIQAADAAGLVQQDELLTAVIHAWPPLSAILCVHLFVLLMQSLGFLVPPIAEDARPPLVVRVWTWTVSTVRQTAAVTASTSTSTSTPMQLQSGDTAALTSGVDVDAPVVDAPAVEVDAPIAGHTDVHPPAAVNREQAAAVDVLVAAVTEVGAAVRRREPTRSPGRERDVTKIVKEVQRDPARWQKPDGSWGLNKIQRGDWGAIGEERLSQKTAQKVVERLTVEGAVKDAADGGSGSRAKGKGASTPLHHDRVGSRASVPDGPDEQTLRLVGGS